MEIRTVFCYPAARIFNFCGLDTLCTIGGGGCNSFCRGLSLVVIHTVLEELWPEVHDIVQEAVIKNIPKEKKCKKAK